MPVNTSADSRAPQAAESLVIDFMADADSVEIARQVSREYYSFGVPNGRTACAKCGKIELDSIHGYDPDFGADVTFSDNLQKCSNCTDCLIHPACASSVPDAGSGLCPHCAILVRDKRDHEAMESDLLSESERYAEQELRHFIEMLGKEPDEARRAEKMQTLGRLGQIALDAYASENRRLLAVPA